MSAEGERSAGSGCFCDAAVDCDVAQLRIGSTGAGGDSDAGSGIKRRLDSAGGDDGAVVAGGKVGITADVGVRACGLDNDVVGIEQPLAAFAFACRGFDFCAFDIQPMSGGLDKAAVTALAAAFRADSAIGPSRLIGPDDDFAAVAIAVGVGFNRSVFTDVGGFSIMDVGIFTLIIAAD